MPTGLGDEQLWLSATNDNTGTSTAFNDQSGNGNDGTASGTLVVADTSEGGTYAYSLDGAGDFISLGNVLDSDEFDPLSYSFWMNANSTSDSYNAIMNKLNKFGTPRGHSIGYRGTSASNSGGLTFILRNSPSNNIIVSTPSGSVSGGWYHVAMTYDGSSNASGVKIYIDAVSSASAGPTDTLNGTTVTTEPYSIGSRDGNDFFDGLLDDIRQYDRVLTQAEVTHLAEARGIEGPPPVGLGDEKLWLCPSINDSANDISGNGNNGTYNGGMGTVANTGEGGTYAYDFDGVDDRIDCPSSVLGGSQVFSMSCWVYVDSHDATYGEGFMGQWDNNASSNKAGMIYSGAATSFRGLVTAGGTNYTSTASGTSPPTGSWHHLASVVDGSNVTLYVDGVSQGATAYSGSISSSPANAFEIGRYQGSFGANDRHCLDGKMDDIRAYNRTLTQAEITHLASSRGVEGTPDIPTGLGTETGWWMPTYSEDNPSTPNIASSTVGSYNIVPTNIDSSDFVVDTDNGGEWAALSTYSTSTGHENRVVTGIKSQVFDTGGWTMTGWVKTVSPTNTQHIYDTDGGWVFRMQNGVFRLLGGINFTTTTTVPNNQWFHFAMSVDSSRTNYKFYMDGVLEETLTTSAFPTTGTDAIYISAQQSGNYNINGRWDDFRLFNTQISDADVATLASSRGAGGSAPPSSVFYNPFKSQAFHTLIGQRIR